MMRCHLPTVRIAIRKNDKCQGGCRKKETVAGNVKYYSVVEN
jgi:hypothetical protein